MSVVVHDEDKFGDIGATLLQYPWSECAIPFLERVELERAYVSPAGQLDLVKLAEAKQANSTTDSPASVASANSRA